MAKSPPVVAPRGATSPFQPERARRPATTKARRTADAKALDLALPGYRTGGAVLKLAAAVLSPVELQPGTSALIPTGIALNVPPGFVLAVSGVRRLALSHHVVLATGVDLLDAVDEGEVMVPLLNLSRSDPYSVGPGEVVALAALLPASKLDWDETDGA